MYLAIVQTNPLFGKPKENIEAAIELMNREKADLYVLPELFNTGYNFIDKSEATYYATKADGPLVKEFSKFLKKINGYVVYGFVELSNVVYNSAALVGSQGLIGLYRKIHLFDREKMLFEPGNLGFSVFDLPFGRIGIMICFDWFFPESARTLALKGAQLIAHPANLVLPYCPDAMVVRCLENKIFAATANRIGTEDRGNSNLSFIGLSEIVAPNGNILAQLSTDQVGISVVEIDLEQSKKKNITSRNDAFSDRRPDQYEL